MTASRGSIFAILISFLVCLHGSNDTNMLLRKSVGFSYTLTDGFLSLIRGRNHENISGEVFNFMKENVADSYNQSFSAIKPMLTTISFSYIGYVVCLAFGILFVVVIPIAGLLICCCRCCNRCGAKPRLTYNKHDKKKLGFYSILLLILVTIQLIAIIVAFINHHLAYEAITEKNSVSFFSEMKNGFEQMERSVDSLVTKTKSTNNQVDLTEQKKEFFSTVDELLNDYKKNLMSNEAVVNYTMPTKHFMKLTNEFRGEKGEEKGIPAFFDHVNSIDQNIDSLRTRIVEIVNKCPNVDKILECNRIRKLTDESLRYNLNKEQLQHDKVNAYFDTLVGQKANLDKLDQIDQIWKDIDVNDKIKDKLNDAWKELSENDEKRKQLSSLFDKLGNTTNHYISVGKEQLSSYSRVIQDKSDYGYYGIIVILSIVVWIIFLIYLGLCFGTCGTRPYIDSGACNKGVGANLLLAALGFIFIFSSIMMIVCMVQFIGGGLVQSEICYSFEDHGRNETNFLDNLFSFISNRTENYDFQHLKPVDAIWKKCKNDSFVNSLGGPNLKLPVDNEIRVELDKVMTELRQVNIEEPVREKIEEMIRAYESFSLLNSFAFTKTIEELKKTIVMPAINFDSYIPSLEALNIDELNDPINQLKTEILPYDMKRKQIRAYLEEIDESLRMMKTSHSKLQEMKDKTGEIVRPLFETGLKTLEPKFFGQLRMAVLAMWQPIKCDELQLAAKRTSDGFCKKFIQPMNGIWAGLGLCLILYIPIICLIIGLVSIYRKTEDYLSDFEEPDFDDFDNFISFKGFYISPNSDQNDPKDAKKKKRKTNGVYYEEVPDDNI